MKFLAAVAVISLFAFTEAKYSNFKVYKVTINSEKQYELVKQLKLSTPECEFWNNLRNYGDSLDVMVPPQFLEYFQMELSNSSIKYEEKISDVQKLIDRSYAKKTSREEEVMEWTDYHDLPIIEKWMEGIAAKFPKQVTVFNIGKSLEGRDIKGLKISFKPGNKAVFLESNIHAREWITSATITWFIEQLLHSQKPAVRDIARNIDWHIIPVLNVDGFTFSHAAKENRMWRKSRRPINGPKCMGVDMNRNFDFLWMSAGASDDPCDETYAGPYPLSEPEIEHVQNYVLPFPDDYFKIYVSLHSYGQYVLSPWGHTSEEFPENYDDMVGAAKGFADALYRRYETVFTYGSSSTVLYKVSGSGKEWAYGVKNIPIPYTIELRDKGKYGFLLPPEQIIEVAHEVQEGFIGLIKACVDRNVIPSWK
ncbi:hypothetical protein ACFFRR_003539 [Megaselia abdita]